MAYGDLINGGTVTGALNATTVTGDGTAWASGPTPVKAGDELYVAGYVYPIKAVTDTSLTLAVPLMSALMASWYAIRLSAPARLAPAQVAASVADLVATAQFLASSALAIGCLGIGSTAPPATPASGDTYALGAAPTGAWSGHSGAFARWTGSAWWYTAAQPGQVAIKVSTGEMSYRSAAGAWQPIYLSAEALAALAANVTTVNTKAAEAAASAAAAAAAVAAASGDLTFTAAGTQRYDARVPGMVYSDAATLAGNSTGAYLALDSGLWPSQDAAAAYGTLSLLGTMPLDAAPWALFGASNGAVSRNATSVTTSTSGQGIAIPVTQGKWYQIKSIYAQTGSHYWIAEGVGTVYRSSPGGCIFKATSASLILYSVAGGTVTFTSLEIRELPGFAGIQTTSTSRPTYLTSGALSFDGSDDHLVTDLVAAQAMTAIARITPSAAATLRVVAGIAGASAGAFGLGLDAGGYVCGAVGADGYGTIKGATNRNGQDCVIALVAGTTKVRLYENGQLVFSKARNGAIDTTQKFRLGAMITNGTLSGYFGGLMPKLQLIQRELTDIEIAAVAAAWRA